jgi:hypothetical protein
MAPRLVKLLDYSLLPFSVLILSKLLGLHYVFTSLHIEWGVADYAGGIITATPVVYGRDLQLVSTYSNLFMFLAMFIGGSLLVAISFLRHRSANNPEFLRKLINLPQMNLLEKGLLFYTRIYVWAIYLWLATGYILLDVLMGRTAAWLALVAFALSVLLTAVLAQDSIKEFNYQSSGQRLAL